MYSISKRLFYSEMRRGKCFLRPTIYQSKAGFVIPSLRAGSASGWDEEVADLPECGVSGAHKVQREG